MKFNFSNVQTLQRTQRTPQGAKYRRNQLSPAKYCGGQCNYKIACQPKTFESVNKNIQNDGTKIADTG